MLIICDFDGTVTARDTNSEIARRFAPEAAARVEGALRRRDMTIRQVLTTEYAEVHASLSEVLDVAMRIPFRAGFGPFLDEAGKRGADIVLLSSGFHELIEPLLERDGLHGRVPLVANRISFETGAGVITWRELPDCGRCGEACKRADVEQLRASTATAAEVVFVGDGFSDRCGAEAADRIFARDALATWLDASGVRYEHWEDFEDVARALWQDRVAGVDA